MPFQEFIVLSTAPLAPVTRLWLIRHAEVEARYQGVFGGRIDMDLSPRGHLQAAALAKYLRGHSFDAVFSSPMKRVQQTLAPALVNPAMPRPTIMDGLREVDFGDWTGLGWDQVQEKYGISAFDWLDQLECAGIRNAECSSTFRTRVEPCLKHIVETQPGKQVAIFCHGGVIRMLLAIALDLPLPRMAAFDVEYASIAQVWWEPGDPELRLLNFTPWRDIPSA